MHLYIIFGSAWLLSIGLFGIAVTGLIRRWSPFRVLYCLQAAVTIAALISPAFGYAAWIVYTEAFVNHELHTGQNFWLIVCALGMPSILLMVLLLAAPLLGLSARRCSASESMRS